MRWMNFWKCFVTKNPFWNLALEKYPSFSVDQFNYTMSIYFNNAPLHVFSFYAFLYLPSLSKNPRKSLSKVTHRYIDFSDLLVGCIFDQLFVCCFIVYSDQLLVGLSYTVTSYHDSESIRSSRYLTLKINFCTNFNQ